MFLSPITDIFTKKYAIYRPISKKEKLNIPMCVYYALGPVRGSIPAVETFYLYF